VASAGRKGGTLGGIEWGSAADKANVYVGLSDITRTLVPYSVNTDTDPKQGGGMFALGLEKGERVWYTPPPGCGERKRCSPAQSAAVSAIPGAVFSGSVDGHLRAYSTKDGSILWDFDTVGPYKTRSMVLRQKAAPWMAGAPLLPAEWFSWTQDT
jgi:polyvinyl alcohol dehydrogenase (cytochrome)